MENQPLRDILAISGRPGLFRLVNRGRGNLIVESIIDKKRSPAHQTDRVSSLADISMFTVDDDKPLPEILTALHALTQGQPVNGKAMDDHAIREYFRQVLPDFDDERVHTSDIRKLLNWYNLLLQAGITEYVAPREEEKEEGKAD